MTKEQLELNVDSVLAATEQSQDPKEQFCIVWNGTIKHVLEFVKIFTGPNVDEQINNLIYAADKVCDNTNPDVTNYCNAWKTLRIKELLLFVKKFTGVKVDKAIDKFIEISDSFCPQQ